MNYYSQGDEVIYAPKGCGGKIIQTLPGEEYIVEFDDKNLIPPQMQIPGQYLIPKPVHLYGGYQPVETDIIRKPIVNTKETHCPKCNTPWHETVIGQRSFYDCLKCVLRKEDA